MEFHPVVNLFPMMSSDEFDALAEDIEANGLREPIWTHEGKIIDGRNRYMACGRAGVTPSFRVWNGEGSLVQFVVSLNLNRRHLSSAQKAMVAADMLPLLEDEARKRQGVRTDLTCVKDLTEVRSPVRAAQQAAAITGTNRQYVSDAKQIKERAPEVAEKVREGKLSMPDAKVLVKLSEPQRAAVIAKVESGEAANVKAAHREIKSELNEARRPAPVQSGPVPKLYEGRAEDLCFLVDETVDLFITSPPYNLGAEEWPMGGDGRTHRTDGIGYEDAMDEAEYQDWQIQALQEWYRVAKPGASLFYNHKVRQHNGMVIHPLDWLRRADNPWTLRQEIIWDRESTHNHTATLFWQHDERVYWLTKGKPAFPDRPLGMPTIWRFHGPAPNTWHPAPFDEELPRIILRAIGRPGVVVMDPFGGSMTTCAVAQKLGFESIGVDVNKEFVRRARGERGWTIN